MKYGLIFLLAGVMFCGKSASETPATPTTTTPTVSDSSIPSVGTAIVFSSVADTTLTVSWGAASDNLTTQANLRYRLVKASSSAAIDTIAEVDAVVGADLLQDYAANDLTQNVTGLTGGTTYYFAVVVADAANNKALYGPASRTTTTPDTVAPTSGTGITFASVADTTLTVNWGAATDNVTAQASLQYRLVKASSAAAIDTIAEVDAITGADLLQDYSANDLTQNVVGLTAVTTYFFAVVVRDVAGNKTIYTPASQTTTAAPDLTAPVAGSGISFSAVTNTTLTVTWGAATDNVSPQANLQYRLVKGPTATAIDTIAEVDAVSGNNLLQDYTSNDLTENVTGLFAGTTYFFAVVVRDVAGNKSLYTPASQTMTGVADTTVPDVVSTNPVHTATNVPVCTGNPCLAVISIVFTESMNTSLSQTINLQIWNGGSYVAVPATNTTAVWSTTTNTNDTLNLNVSWKWFPENSRVRFNVASAGLQDLVGNQIVDPVDRYFTTGSASQSFPVAETGQSTCYDLSAAIGCNAPLYPGQDGDFPDTPLAKSYTGPTQYLATTDYTTTDNVTGLVWKTCSEGQSGASCTGGTTTMTWASAMNQCSALNAMNSGAGYAGSTRWRLPTMAELDTLPNYSATNPAISTANFPATNGTNYWTMTSPNSSYADSHFVNLQIGKTNHASKTNAYSVRCVSSPATISAVSFSDNADGTVSDTVTGLRWQKCQAGQTNDTNCTGSQAVTYSWRDALQYCSALSLGSFGNSSNWRLPSINELKSLVDRVPTISNSIKAKALFPNSGNGNFWTSTTYVGFAFNAWNVSFVAGASNGDNAATPSTVKTATFNVRCVSTGP